MDRIPRIPDRDPELDFIVKHQDARRQLTEEEIARDYTEQCRDCGEPAKPSDRGQCLSCWRREEFG